MRFVWTGGTLLEGVSNVLEGRVISALKEILAQLGGGWKKVGAEAHKH